jgi:hypothetical protein
VVNKHDKGFSVDGSVSCAKCHVDNLAFTDGLVVSAGHNGLTGTRNAPTVLNAAFNKSQFWDGREPDLEGQSKQPLINPVEHGLALIVYPYFIPNTVVLVLTGLLLVAIPYFFPALSKSDKGMRSAIYSEISISLKSEKFLFVTNAL